MARDGALSLLLVAIESARVETGRLRMARGSPKRVVYGWPVVVCGCSRVPKNGSSADGLWSSTDGRGKHRCKLCRRQSRFHGLQIVENIVEIFDIPSESLDTASVRRVTPAEFVDVIEIAAPLPAELESPMFVTASARVEQDRSRLCFCLGIQEQALRALEFYQRDDTDGMRLVWKLLVVVVSQSFQEVVKAANTAPSVIVMGFHSSATVDVEHFALWEIPTVQGGQTTENLGTAPVRHVAQAVIVVVVEL